MNYWKRYTGDYLRDTIHLTPAQDGFYGRLLDIYYSTEKPLSLDVEELYSAARAFRPEFRQDVDIILRKFFKKTTLGYRNKRADIEIKLAKPSIYAAQKNGKKGGRPKTQKKPSGFSDQNPVGSILVTSPAPAPAPAPQPLNSNTNSKAIAHSNFDLFWDCYPRKVSKAAALRVWSKTPGADEHVLEIVAAVECWKRTDQWQDENFIPYPATFLNRKQWQDQISEEAHGTARTAAEKRHDVTARAIGRVFGDVVGDVPPVVSPADRGTGGGGISGGPKKLLCGPN